MTRIALSFSGSIARNPRFLDDDSLGARGNKVLHAGGHHIAIDGVEGDESMLPILIVGLQATVADLVVSISTKGLATRAPSASPVSKGAPLSRFPCLSGLGTRKELIKAENGPARPVGRDRSPGEVKIPQLLSGIDPLLVMPCVRMIPEPSISEPKNEARLEAPKRLGSNVASKALVLRNSNLDIWAKWVVETRASASLWSWVRGLSNPGSSEEEGE